MIIHKIPKGLRKLVPYSIKRFLVRMYVRWSMRGCPGPQDIPRLSFASILPSQGSFIRGGKVKLTHLRKRFGEFNTAYNILYLVSSTLPGFPDIWVDEAKRKGIRIVWNQNGCGNPNWTDEWQRINNMMKPIVHADYVVYQSEFCRTEATELVAPFAGPYSIIKNCVDTNKLGPADPPVPSTPIRLLVTGTHMTREKVIIPLEAMRILLDRGHDVFLNIYGPSEWEHADEDIKLALRDLKLEDRVTLHGKYLQDESANIYKSGHILIHTKYADPSPTTPLSAMASGVPVIGSRSGGMPELVSSAAGILLDVPQSREKLFYPSSRAVADAVETIMEDWPMWSRGARDHAVKQFNTTDWTDNHERIFKQILGIK